MNQDLTFKQRAWIKEYLDCHNATEAARRVYDCSTDDVARVIGSENLAKLNFGDLMEEAGVTDDILVRKLREGLEATRTVSAIVTGTKRRAIERGEAKEPTLKDATANSVDFIDVPDYAVQHKYLETSLKLKKRLVDKIDGVTVNVMQISFDLNDNNKTLGADSTTAETEGSTRSLTEPKV